MIELDYHTLQQPMLQYVGPSSWNDYPVSHHVKLVQPYIDSIQQAIFADLERELRGRLPDASGGPGEFITLRVPQATNFNSCKREKEGCIAVGEYFHGRARVSSYREVTETKHVKIIETPYWEKAKLDFGTYHLDDIHSIGAFEPTPELCYDGQHQIGLTVRAKQFTPLPPMSNVLLSELVGFAPDNELITEAIANLNGKTLDLLTTLAEAPETVSMIYDALKSILMLAREFKRKMRGLSLDTAANLWLQYRYGIMPLVYTVQDGLEVLKNLSNEITYIDEKKKRREFESRSVLGVDVTEQVTHRVFLKRRIDPSQSLSNEFSINPFVTAWELVTLSFVVDWVLNVGNVISALTTPISWQEEKCTYSLKRECNVQIDGLSIEYETYQRIIINNPTNHVKLALNPEMNRNRWLDLLALSKVILSGK